MPFSSDFQKKSLDAFCHTAVQIFASKVNGTGVHV